MNHGRCKFLNVLTCQEERKARVVKKEEKEMMKRKIIEKKENGSDINEEGEKQGTLRFRERKEQIYSRKRNDQD